MVGLSCIEGGHRRFVESNLACFGVLLRMLNAARSRDQHRVRRMRDLPCQADLRCRHPETESDGLDTVLVDDLGECAEATTEGEYGIHAMSFLTQSSSSGSWERSTM